MVSPIEREGFYYHNGRRLCRSDFNTVWFQEILGRSPRIIADVGAYDLGDSIRFAEAFPEAMIYSFEGCPGRNKIIQEYVGDYPSIIHSPYAVSDTVGNIEWYSAACNNDVTPEDYGAQGSILKHTNEYKNTYRFIKQAQEPVRVPCTTLDYVFGPTSIDLAHIDVEGAEKYVVGGFGRCRPKLVYVETLFDGGGWEGGTKEQELYDLLVNMGYRKIISNGINTLYKYEK